MSDLQSVCSILLTGLQSCRLHFTMKQNAGSSQGHNMQSCSNFKLPKPQGSHKGATREAPFQLLTRDIGPVRICAHPNERELRRIDDIDPQSLGCALSLPTRSPCQSILFLRPEAALQELKKLLLDPIDFNGFSLRCMVSRAFFLCCGVELALLQLLQCSNSCLRSASVRSFCLPQSWWNPERSGEIMGKMRSTVTVQASIIGPKIWDSSSACSFGRCSSSLQQFIGRRLEEPMSLDRRLSSKEQRAKSCMETWLMT